jgi:hypothetical protein
MDQTEFVKEEYKTLRDEIKDSKTRLFQIMTVGASLIPAVNVLGVKLDANEFVLVTPLLVLVFGLLYLSENNAVMRCGAYIKQHVEAKVADHKGWEHWIEEDVSNRKVDKLSAYSFYSLFAVYYVAGTFFALKFAYAAYNALVVGLLAGAYIGSGILIAYVLINSVRVAHSTTAFRRSAARQI